ncbi:hypothetical protein Misp01_18700 [Microtetraspora sp. NBRC 13810]|uniref:DUF6458 family protein n=1 Tax=Microtetraspora sp. NBRC 13810 TaxID=3030990 RepID=UPI0024A25313|nr:DUF6458 family protein [Microtetraspora sp. NBRC 13810]GLW06740.1 hypothetical protein Misp01_18700 [Microtetraspora sp. NBRC 13810]
MGFGASLAFVAIGAILAFAVKWDVPGIDLQLIGWIFMLVGLVAGAITLFYTRRPREETIEVVDPDVMYTVDPSADGEPHVHRTTHVEETRSPVHPERPGHPTRPVYRDGPI